VSDSLFVHRLILQARPRCPYLQVARGYWEVLLRTALGQPLKPRVQLDVLFDAFIERFEIAGHSQLAVAHPIPAAMFSACAVDVGVSFSGLPKGAKASLTLVNRWRFPMDLYGVLLVSRAGRAS